MRKKTVASRERRFKTMLKERNIICGGSLILVTMFAIGVWFGYCVGHTAAETEFARQTENTPVASASVIPTEKEVTTVPEYTEMTVTATAYCSCEMCCGKTDGITATGTKATAGRTIAADPSVIPYGTEVIINGNTYVVEDCGAGVKGNCIDIYFDSHAEALAFGRQQLVVSVRG